MKRIGLLCLLLLQMTSTATTSRYYGYQPDEIVTKLIEKYELLTEMSLNSTENLQLMAKTSSEFIKLALPLGALLSASLKIVEKPESEEFKAMEKLERDISNKLEELGKYRKYDFRSTESSQEIFDFKTHITVQINTLFDYIGLILDPRIRKNREDINRLVVACADPTFGVLNMTEYIMEHVSQGCELNKTFAYAHAETLLDNLERRFGVRYWNEDALHLRRQIYRTLAALPSNVTIPKLKSLHLELIEYPSFAQSIHKLHESLRHLKSPFPPSKCLTDGVFEGNSYDRRKVDSYGRTVQIELGRLMLATTICANFTHPSRSESFDHFVGVVQNSTITVAQFLADYLPKKLNMSVWGKESRVVRRVINNFEETKGDIPPSRFENLIQKIKNALHHIGHPKVEKQYLTLLSESADSHMNIHNECPAFWCSKVMGVRGVDVTIARMMKSDIRYAVELQNHRHRLMEEKLFKVLKLNYWKSLPRILDLLKREQNATITTDWQKTGVVVRHKTFCNVNCGFYSVTQNYTSVEDSTAGLTRIGYRNNYKTSWFHDNTCFEFFLFL